MRAKVGDAGGQADFGCFLRCLKRKDPADRGGDNPLPSVLGHVEPTAEGVAYAQEVWSRTDELLFGGGLWDR